MIHWLWLIAPLVIGYWIGKASAKGFGSGATTGIVGTLLALIWIG